MLKGHSTQLSCCTLFCRLRRSSRNRCQFGSGILVSCYPPKPPDHGTDDFSSTQLNQSRDNCPLASRAEESANVLANIV